MPALTQRQSEILDLIRETVQATGIPPTRAEIARALGFRSVNAAEGHLRALARKGVIELVPGSSRGIRILQEAGLPVVGRVAAGTPVLAVEHIEGHYQLDPRLFTPRADYLLRVRGHSMRGAGIHDGDLLAVHRTNDAEDGQVVVARVDDEVTVKRFQRRGNKVLLIAENPEFPHIEVDPTRQHLEIEGRGVGVIRNVPTL